MVSREECIETINKFIKNPDIKLIVILFENLCELKGESSKEEMEAVINNSFLISTLAPNILEEIQRELKINKITKNNILITVF